MRNNALDDRKGIMPATKKSATPKIKNDDTVFTAHDLACEELEHTRYGDTGIDERGTLGAY